MVESSVQTKYFLVDFSSVMTAISLFVQRLSVARFLHWTLVSSFPPAATSTEHS